MAPHVRKSFFFLPQNGNTEAIISRKSHSEISAGLSVREPIQYVYCVVCKLFDLLHNARLFFDHFQIKRYMRDGLIGSQFCAGDMAGGKDTCKRFT